MFTTCFFYELSFLIVQVFLELMSNYKNKMLHLKKETFVITHTSNFSLWTPRFSYKTSTSSLKRPIIIISPSGDVNI